MKFHYTHQVLKGKEKFFQRLFEIIPGTLSWLILLSMCALSFYKPLISAIVIIAFDLYWIVRIFYLNIFLIFSYMRLSAEKKTNWAQRLKELDNIEHYEKGFKNNYARLSLKEKISFLIHQKEIELLRKSRLSLMPWDSVYHLVIIPVVKESREIVEVGLKSLVSGSFACKRMLMIFALEERAQENIKTDVWRMQSKYKNNFYDLLVVTHPVDLPGEARVKGANATYAAQKAAEYFKEKDIPYENVIVSCFDADTVVTPEYFSCLTYYYIVTPHRTRASFQPIPVYHNNIWEAPSFARVLDIGSSFFQLVEATNPEKLVTFSSHSMSFKALVEIGYWPLDIISDDSAIFWKAFIHFDGDYRVVPIYTTLSMDITVGKTRWETFKNVYKQKRRWAWGIENFPIVMRAFLKAENISLYKRLKHAFKLLEGHISWATWPFILTIVGWLPALFAEREFVNSIVYFSTARIRGTIFSLASIALLNCIFLSMLLLPKQKIRFRFFKKLKHTIEWVFIPLISVFLSAIPALDAQTHLMLGKYMEFWVSVKKRKTI